MRSFGRFPVLKALPHDEEATTTEMLPSPSGLSTGQRLLELSLNSDVASQVTPNS